MGHTASGTVLRMPPTAPGRAVSRSHRQEIRRRRLAVVVAVAILAIGILSVTAFGGGDHPAARVTAPASAARLLPAGPPALQAIARVGSLTLELPLSQSRLTAIGYFAASDGGLGLSPIGTQANQGLLKRLVHSVFGGSTSSPRWYLLSGGEGPANSALDVGAPSGTDVYSPVDGTVVGIEKTILNGKPHGQRIDIQPTVSPSLVVSVSALKVDPALTVGNAVTAGSTKLGVLLDLSRVEKQELARYTNDAGDHVLIEVYPAATLNVR